VVSESITSVLSASECPLNAAMAVHEGLVHWVVRRQRRGSLSFDDALHAGRIGLWHALQNYDPRRGTCFSSYAVPAIAHAVWEAVAVAVTEPIPLLSPLAERAEETDLRAALHQAQVRAALDALVAQLSPRLRAVVVWHYGLAGTLPQTFAQIGQSWGVSRQRVHQLHQRALLVLAHPAHSQALRRLVDRAQRGAYQHTLARQHRVARRSRR